GNWRAVRLRRRRPGLRPRHGQAVAPVEGAGADVGRETIVVGYYDARRRLLGCERQPALRDVDCDEAVVGGLPACLVPVRQVPPHDVQRRYRAVRQSWKGCAVRHYAQAALGAVVAAVARWVLASCLTGLVLP